MNILVLSNLFPPHSYGGYEMSCRDVVDRFRSRGHDVTVLTSTARLPSIREEDVAPPPLRLLVPYWDWEQHRPVVPARWRRLSVERANQRALSVAIEVARPDVVSVWHMGALSLSLLTEIEHRGLPMVLTLGDDWLVYGPDLDPWTRLFRRHRYLRRVARCAGVPTRLPSLAGARVNFVSSATKERALAASTWRFDAAEVIPPGVDCQDFPVSEPTGNRWRWRLLYVGRIDGTKGIETLLRAMPALPAITELDIVGGGNEGYRRDLQRLCVELGVDKRVRFDVCARAELRHRYRQSDVVVFPSEWEEPFGLVPLEAMACAVPVVATGRGGSGEYLVDRENCLLFEAGSAQDLARTLQGLAEDAFLREQLVAGGRRLASQLTIDRYADRLEALHVRCVGSSVPTR